MRLPARSRMHFARCGVRVKRCGKWVPGSSAGQVHKKAFRSGSKLLESLDGLRGLTDPVDDTNDLGLVGITQLVFNREAAESDRHGSIKRTAKPNAESVATNHLKRAAGNGLRLPDFCLDVGQHRLK